MASNSENEQFTKALLPTYPLDDALSWIKDNLEITDVYEEKEIVQHIRDNYDPEVVFSTKELQEWAESNGFVKDKVMYLVNSKNNNLVNGTLGIFVSHSDCHYIRVGEVDYALERVQCVKKEYVLNKAEDTLELVEIGSIDQYPIKLAYALSIHKSQGLTFEEVTVDLTKPCFQKGQLYVALSRVTAPKGLRIITS